MRSIYSRVNDYEFEIQKNENNIFVYFKKKSDMIPKSHVMIIMNIHTVTQTYIQQTNRQIAKKTTKNQEILVHDVEELFFE